MLGGEESTPGQWPWQVNLYSLIPCSGAILTPTFILTAANCFGKVNKSYFTQKVIVRSFYGPCFPVFGLARKTLNTNIFRQLCLYLPSHELLLIALIKYIIYIYIYKICIYIYIYIYIYTFIYIYIYKIYIYIYVYIYTYICNIYIYVCVYKYVYIRI